MGTEETVEITVRLSKSAFAFAMEALAKAAHKAAQAQAKPIACDDLDFDAIFRSYPKRNGGHGKKAALAYCAKHYNTAEKYERLALAVKNYKAHCLINAKEGSQYVRQFLTFVRNDVDEWADKQPLFAPKLRTLEELEAEEAGAGNA